MSETDAKSYTDFVLPSNLVTKLDVSRVVSELERVDNELVESDVRAKAGGQAEDKPALSQQLSEFLEKNQLNLDDDKGRSELVKQMRLMKDNLPMVHMTFAVPADGESLQQLANWFRESIHPQTVIEVGLQPALVAGVYLRTPNHVHDLSLRAMLSGKHDLLVGELEALRGAK